MRFIAFPIVLVLVGVLSILADPAGGALQISGSPVLGLAATPALRGPGAAYVPADCLIEAFGPSVAATPPAARSGEGLPTAYTITIHDGLYDPCALTIPANTPVTLTITDAGTAIGRLIIDELGIMTDVLEPGDSQQVEVNAPPGIYVYYSDLPGHLEAGVVGILTVVGSVTAATPSAETPSP